MCPVNIFENFVMKAVISAAVSKFLTIHRISKETQAIWHEIRTPIITTMIDIVFDSIRFEYFLFVHWEQEKIFVHFPRAVLQPRNGCVSPTYPLIFALYQCDSGTSLVTILMKYLRSPSIYPSRVKELEIWSCLVEIRNVTYKESGLLTFLKNIWVLMYVFDGITFFEFYDCIWVRSPIYITLNVRYSTWK